MLFLFDDWCYRSVLFSIALLDSYATPAYITANPVPFHEAPIRYLRTKGLLPLVRNSLLLTVQTGISLKVYHKTPNIEPFSPPNLIQTTSASFLSILSTRLAHPSTQDPNPSGTGTLILLPIAHIPPPPPSSIAPTSLSNLDDESEARWKTKFVRQAQSVLFGALGEKGGEWEALSDKSGDVEKPKIGRRGDLGEGGMYI
jgi:hypothetical protein